METKHTPTPWGGIVMNNPEIIWTFEYNDELRDYQCETVNEVAKAADDWFYKHWADCYLEEGESRTDECYIVAIDNDGKEVKRYGYRLFYECTGGDDEHRTY